MAVSLSVSVWARQLLTGALLVTLAPCAATGLQARLGDTSLRVGGQFQTDFLFGATEQAVEGERRADIRRARLRASWRFLRRWRLHTSVEFAGNDPALRSLRLEYRRGGYRFGIGRSQPLFGLAAIESVQAQSLLERPLAVAFAPRFNTGVDIGKRVGRCGSSGGLYFGQAVGLALEEVDRAAEDSVSLRLTCNPLRTDRWLLHVGTSAAVRFAPDDLGVRFVRNAESFLTPRLRLAHPRLRDAPRYGVAGLELALRHGPLLLQAEYLRADVSRRRADDPAFDGYYIQGSWLLTGERRPYSTRFGTFGAARPEAPLSGGGPGALELAVRYGALDLRETDADLDGDPDGEEGQVIGAGLNWYPTARTKVMFGASHFIETQGPRRQTETTYQGRLQFLF